MHIVFVTTELAPLTPGGAGAVVARLRERLIGRGDRVSVILVAEVGGDLPEGVTAVESSPGFDDRTVAAAGELRRLVVQDRPDLIEIQDFDGIGFHALTHRCEFAIDRIPTQIRFHGPADLMFEAIGVEPPEIAVARSMEASGYRMADRTVVPSAGIGRLVTDRYDVEDDRIVVGMPPMPPAPTIVPDPASTPTLVCVGRLGEVKGTHDLVEAAIPLLRERPDLHLVLVGEDGWSATASKPMSEWLRDDLIPEDVADQIELAGRLEGEPLQRRMAEAWAIVVPSRFESFNLVAHEARLAGLPVIVPNLPSFDGFLHDSTGALVYDTTVDGLTAAMRRMIDNEGLRCRLAEASLPGREDPLIPYETLPVVRHPRSQAGLATTAVQRLERDRPTIRDDGEPTVDERSRIRRTGYAALMALSEPRARAVVEVIPQRLRAKLGFVADWRDEMRLREVVAAAAAEAARVEAEKAVLDSRVASGEFPDLSDPLVSIVIPCHDDGRYLDDSIRSVFNQTMTSFEVIVVDDGSTDPETVAIIDALPWTRTRVIRQANAGLPAARNTGMSVARGVYVVPLDADDELDPRYLERMVAALEREPFAAFAACRARLFEDIDAVWIPRPYNPYQMLLSNSIVGCVLLRRDDYVAVGGYDETLLYGNEDWDLWLRLLEAGRGVVEVPEVLFRYRKHGISMSVETEARFEQGRAEIVGRHPDLYRRDRLVAMKQERYPLLSIIVDGDADLPLLVEQDIVDAEIVIVGTAPEVEALANARRWPVRRATDLGDAVQRSAGKFVVRWHGVTGAESDALDRLTDRLERDPKVGAAHSSEKNPLTVVRRWSLLDPAAPSSTVTVDAPGTGTSQLSPGAFPDPAWMVPDVIGDVPVQRQRPEEEGRLPSWINR